MYELIDALSHCRVREGFRMAEDALDPQQLFVYTYLFIFYSADQSCSLGQRLRACSMLVSTSVRRKRLIARVLQRFEGRLGICEGSQGPKT
jgi:hypothetical protein